MRKMNGHATAAVVLGVLAIAAGWGMAQEESGALAPEVWIHEGDSDGDGLLDGFERANGLDPDKVDSLGDGTVDESRPAPDGVRTLWEAQKAEQDAAAAVGANGGGRACGALGMEAALIFGLLWAMPTILRSRL